MQASRNRSRRRSNHRRPSLGALPIIEAVAGGVALPPTLAPLALSDVHIGAPLPRPRRNIFCVGKNYHAHAKEFADSIELPVGVSEAIDYEAELAQNTNTTDLIFNIPTLIETLSAGITLYPGDVIATGTPVGVGIGFKPPRYLKSGDVVRVEIDGIGQLENPVR